MTNHQALHDLILQAADEGIFGLDLEGKHTFVNAAASRILGFDEKELLGQPSHTLWHHTRDNGDPYPAEECPIYGAYKDGKIHHGDDEVFWRKDGTSFPVQYSSRPIFDQDESLLGAVVTFRDISARREAEQTITELRRQNDYVLNSAAEGIFGLDLEGCHTFVNPSAAELLGYEISELLGQPSHTLWHHTKDNGSPYPQEECPIYGAYKDGLVHIGEDERFWRKDGSSFIAQYSSTPMRNSEGELIGAVVTFQDITERKRLAAQLLEAAKIAEVTRVLGNVGHDIKNMLMPVLTGTSLLEDELNDLFRNHTQTGMEEVKKIETTCAELTQMIKQNGQRIQDRVREIADAVKGVTSEPHFVTCQVLPIVEGVMKSLQITAREKGVTLLCKDLESLPSLEADGKRLFTALFNLIGNAIPEVPKGGSVTVTGLTNGTNDMLDLVIADTGKGMPPEVRERLFTKNAISTKAGGTGLGTKIVKDAIDAHNGSIRVESTQGIGTSFFISLPLCQALTPTEEAQQTTGVPENETSQTTF